ncbi:hypothetical protein HOY82DRAFT_408515 [Tuber indicum]|nr:hypothetical protein HOY82DRAFT_408515 [Tuber indicum]
MSTVKANNYLQSLDAARCSGAWESVPELCRKVQKHAPGRKCLALAAATEAHLFLLQRPPSGSAPASVADGDTLTSLQESLVKELELCPPSLPNIPSPAGGGQVGVITLEDVLQARTVLAWIFSLKGEWESALEVVPSEEELGGEWNGGVGKAEYFGITRIKALVLRGLLFVIF